MDIRSLCMEGIDERSGDVGHSPGFCRKALGQVPHAIRKVSDFRGDNKNAGLLELGGTIKKSRALG